MNYEQINKSSLSLKISNISTKIFYQWIKNAKIAYGLNDGDIKQVSSAILREEFVQHLMSAINSLLKENHEEKSISGWSFGYLCGHIQGSLNVKWSNKYIIEQSKEFEDLMIIKSVIGLIELDDSFATKLMIIYDYFLGQRIQPMETIKPLPKKVISIDDKRYRQKKNEHFRKTEAIRYLNDILITNFMSLLNKYETMCCPDITEYLDEQEIKDIVGWEHFA